MKVSIHSDPGSRRGMSYPSVGDQLDALWKIVSSIQGDPSAEEIRAKIQAVKMKYRRSGKQQEK